MNPAEREEMARLLPSPGGPVLASDRLTQLEAHLMREITQEAPSPGTQPSPARPRRRFAAILVPVATAAAVVAGALTLGTGGPQQSTDPEAVKLLNRIATVAAAQQAPAVQDDQYIYTLTQGTQEIMDEGRDTFRRADWQSVDGKRDGLARTTVLSGPSGKGTRDMKLNADPNTTTYRELQALPTDADKLHEQIWTATQGQGPTHEQAALEMIGTMLRNTTLLPEVDAALYRAAAKIPGVSVVQNAKDVAGRAGIGLAFSDGDERDVWVFDRKNLHYLGSNEVALLDIDVVDKVGDTPAG
jgi:hypothetical protein